MPIQFCEAFADGRITICVESASLRYSSKRMAATRMRAVSPGVSYLSSDRTIDLVIIEDWCHIKWSNPRCLYCCRRCHVPLLRPQSQ